MPTPQQVFDQITSGFPKDFGKDNIINATIININQGIYDLNLLAYNKVEVRTDVTGVLENITQRTLARFATVGIDTIQPTDKSFMSKLQINIDDIVEIKGIRHKVIAVTITPMYETIIREL